MDSIMIFNFFFIGIFLNILVHEFGHYIIAKRQGIYKGWGIFPNPHIKLTVRHAARSDYFAGLFASWFLSPLWLVLVGYESLWLFLLLTFAGAIADLFVIVFYGRLKKQKKSP